MKTRVVIIGNGIAGFSAAAAARRLSPESEIVMASAEAEALYSPCVLPEYISGKISRERTYVKAFEDYARLRVETHFGRVVERVDKENTYSQLVFAENRCVGAQFIDPGREAGLIWGLVRQRKPIDLLLESFGKKEVPSRRVLLTRVKPYFWGKDFVNAA